MLTGYSVEGTLAKNLQTEPAFIERYCFTSLCFYTNFYFLKVFEMVVEELHVVAKLKSFPSALTAISFKLPSLSIW